VYSLFQRSRDNSSELALHCGNTGTEETPGETPQSDDLESGVLCTYTPNYVPDDNTTRLKTLRVNIHYLCFSYDNPCNFTPYSNGWGSIPNALLNLEGAGRRIHRNTPRNGWEFAVKFIEAVNNGLGQNAAMKELAPGAPPSPVLKKKIRLEIVKDIAKGDSGLAIYYHYDPSLFYYTRNRFVSDYLNKYGIAKDSVINIFFIHSNDNMPKATLSPPELRPAGTDGWPAHTYLNTYTPHSGQQFFGGQASAWGGNGFIGNSYIGHGFFLQSAWFQYGRSLDPGTATWTKEDPQQRRYANRDMFFISGTGEHELGHLMNLYHTNVPYNEKDSCPDTPNQSQGSKGTWDGGGNNIMEYSKDAQVLTACQLGRAHLWLETHGKKFIVKADSVCEAKPGADIVIPQGAQVEWVATRATPGNVIVKSGGGLLFGARFISPKTQN
jgi:hypothetical protein